MRGRSLKFMVCLSAGVLALAALTVFAYRGGPFENGNQGPPVALQEEEDEEEEDEDLDEEEIDDEEGEDLDEEEDVDDEDDGDDEEGETEDELDDEESYEGGQGAQEIAQAIADEFGVTQEEVLALHEQGIGFGAIFKLYLLAEATGMSVEDLLAEMMDEDGGFSFGQHFHDDELEIAEDLPRNLGQLLSQWHHTNGDAEAAAASDDDDGDDGEGSSLGNSHAFGHGHDR